MAKSVHPWLFRFEIDFGSFFFGKADAPIMQPASVTGQFFCRPVTVAGHLRNLISNI